jgi:hypothetical protein
VLLFGWKTNLKNKINPNTNAKAVKIVVFYERFIEKKTMMPPQTTSPACEFFAYLKPESVFKL